MSEFDSGEWDFYYSLNEYLTDLNFLYPNLIPFPASRGGVRDRGYRTSENQSVNNRLVF